MIPFDIVGEHLAKSGFPCLTTSLQLQKSCSNSTYTFHDPHDATVPTLP